MTDRSTDNRSADIGTVDLHTGDIGTADTRTADTRIAAFEPIEPPEKMVAQMPMTTAAAQVVLEGRESLRRALAGDDRRLVVIVGPCSVHDVDAAREYAGRLSELRRELADHLIVVMRVYFEKPRTTVGWKGLINDPHLDGSCDVNTGLRRARQLLLDINGLGVPCATELLDPITPQYLSDLLAWAAIGARTTESQTPREMASGLSMPVGFKNATDGGLQIALNGIAAASRPHAFLGIDASGHSCVVRTRGNPDVHLVMRGGAEPNYTKPHLAFAKVALEEAPGVRQILVDCSHGNSSKDSAKQAGVFEYLVQVLAGGEQALLGMMLESNLVAGKQPLGDDMTYGQSVTDACIGWETTEQLLRAAHGALSPS